MSASWQAGVAVTAITPAEPMWLAGWAARREPAAGKAMELYAKALALEDPQGARVVIVTVDLIAISRDIATRVQQRSGLPRERLLFNASHTHTAPEVRPDKVPFFEIPPAYADRIAPYVGQLVENLAAVILAALDGLAPATLQVHQARADFAANRRAADGPVDREVPILAVSRSDGRLAAVVFGYACHNLTLPPSYCAYHGDYAGVAQAEIEARCGEAVALFVAGAGADQDPAPRGNISLVQSHGAALADAVVQALAQAGRPVTGTLGVAFEEMLLDLQPVPSREVLHADLASEDLPRRRKAGYLLAALVEQRPLPVQLACPVQVVALGPELLLIALGGEPVAEFALRFKSDFAGPMVWVAGYANDMFGYLPTRRVQQAGGYEGGRATLWSAQPAPLADTAEERVTAAVERLVRRAREPAPRTLR
jgi:neutral ceramidase